MDEKKVDRKKAKETSEKPPEKTSEKLPAEGGSSGSTNKRRPAGNWYVT